jgi:hypothetical protein
MLALAPQKGAARPCGIEGPRNSVSRPILVATEQERSAWTGTHTLDGVGIYIAGAFRASPWIQYPSLLNAVPGFGVRFPTSKTGPVVLLEFEFLLVPNTKLCQSRRT